MSDPDTSAPKAPPSDDAPKPGVFLSYSDCRRMNCGLNWDADTNKAKPVDLDLCYAIYDEYGRLINVVSGKNGTRSNESGSMYHTGDEIDGAYEDDDERLSLDLFAILRVVDSMQLTAKHKVATPVNWKHGEDVIIAGSVTDEDAKKLYPEGWKAPRPYLRVVKQPG